MRSKVLAAVLAGALALFVSGAVRADAGRGGNADAAHACQQGGWQSLRRADGSAFSNPGDCVSYAAHGGTLQTPTVATGLGVFHGEITNTDPLTTDIVGLQPFCFESRVRDEQLYNTYSVTLSQPATLSITLDGASTGGGTLHDPEIDLYSPTFAAGAPCDNIIATSNDAAPAPTISAAVPAGNYVVVVLARDAFYSSLCCGTYTLTIAAS